MLNLNNLQTLLKINGLSATAPEGEIQSTLRAANFTDLEIADALLFLKENISGNGTRVDGLHKVFYSDTHLKPLEISNLLGISVNIDETLQSRRAKTKNNISGLHFIIIWFFSVVCAVTGILFYMYLNSTGLFHPSIAAAQALNHENGL